MATWTDDVTDTWQLGVGLDSVQPALRLMSGSTAVATYFTSVTVKRKTD